MNIDPLIPLILAIIAALPGIYSIYVGRRKAEAETSEKLLAMITGLSEELHKEQQRRQELGKRMIELEETVLRLERILESYRDGVNRLVGQLMAHGLEPVWKPKEELTKRKAGEK